MKYNLKMKTPIIIPNNQNKKMIIKVIYKKNDSFRFDSYLNLISLYTVFKMQSPELTLCEKKERVCIFKIPPLSTSKGYYLDDWKQMIWEGGCKVTEKNHVITITFAGKDGKVFATTDVPPNYKEAIAKTLDSSRGYAIRLTKPGGKGFLWVGCVFRDRNNAFDFGVVFQEYADRQKINTNSLNEQFSDNIDFSLKKGEKIKVNVNESKKIQQNSNDPFSFFDMPTNKQQKNTKNNKQQEWFTDFSVPIKKQEKTNNNNGFDLMDF